MTVYALFAGDFYYPRGGVGDLVMMFEADDDGSAAAQAPVQDQCDWTQLVAIEGASMRLVDEHPHVPPEGSAMIRRNSAIQPTAPPRKGVADHGRV